MKYRRVIKYDYKPRLYWKRPKRQWLKWSRWLLLPAVPAAVTLLVGMASSNIGSLHLPFDSSTTTAQTIRQIPLPLPTQEHPARNRPALAKAAPPVNPLIDHPGTPQSGTAAAGGGDARTNRIDAAEEAGAGQRQSDWKVVTIRRGDNLSVIFGRLGLNSQDLHQILALNADTGELRNLRPGQRLRFRIADGDLQEMVHEEDLTRHLHVWRDGDGFKASQEDVEPAVEIANASGQIHDSLFLAGQKAGLSDNVIMQLFHIFAWDIDFMQDVRSGDRFAVIYQEMMRDGKKVRDGAIVAAEFTVQGKTYRAFRYEEPGGHTSYYNADGESLRKAFLRTPVKFTRISSKFSLHRKHPILHRIRAHLGVDYAAPIGTPVEATGDGRIVFAGRKGGYGNCIVIKHGGKYSTLYGHLSRFRHNIRSGVRVHQGEVIAYVGMTGLATGPHLHYEFRINGVHHDPLTVKLPKALPLPARYMADFKAKTKGLVAELSQMGTTAVAMADSTAAEQHASEAGTGSAGSVR